MVGLTSTATRLAPGNSSCSSANRGPCPLKARCCPKAPERKIPCSIYEDARDAARALAGTEAFEQSRRDRKRAEMLFAHLKRILKLGRLRLRGPCGALTSSRSLPSRRTYVASPRSSADHRQRPPSVPRSYCKRPVLPHQSPLIIGRVAGHGLKQSRPLPRTQYRRLLQQNLAEPDLP